MNGWIKLFRTILHWEWYKDSKTLHVFIHLLLIANHEDRRWRGFLVRRGCVITSYRKISMATGVSVRSVRTALNRLQSTQELTAKTTNKFTLISIRNYDRYQEVFSTTDTQNDTPPENQTTQYQYSTDNKQELKNNKNDKKKDNSNAFELYWDEYHKQTGKSKTDKLPAQKIWEKLNEGEKQSAIDKIDEYSKTNESKYLKKARTYLQDKSFNDEFISKGKKLKPLKNDNSEIKSKTTNYGIQFSEIDSN